MIFLIVLLVVILIGGGFSFLALGLGAFWAWGSTVRERRLRRKDLRDSRRQARRNRRDGFA